MAHASCLIMAWAVHVLAVASDAGPGAVGTLEPMRVGTHGGPVSGGMVHGHAAGRPGRAWTGHGHEASAMNRWPSIFQFIRDYP